MLLIDTHTPELNANIGVLLLKLRGTYNPKNKPELLDSYLVELKNKIAIQAEGDSSLKAAWNYINAELNDDSDHWDQVKFWRKNADDTFEAIILTFTLKETVALVYAALTDKENFWRDALANAPLKKGTLQEQLAYREQFEARYPIDKDHRLLTLFNDFKTLHEKSHKKKVCHTGIRNDITMTLNGVIPGVRLIEDFKEFLISLLEEHLQEQIYAIKISNPERYRDVLLQEIKGEKRSQHLETRLQQTASQLRKKINQQCIEHGINPNEPKTQQDIKNYCAAIDVLGISWGHHESAVIRSLNNLFERKFLRAKEDEVFVRIQQWVEDSFELENKAHQEIVIALAKVKAVNEAYHHHVILKNWDQTILSEQDITQLGTQLQRFRENCLNNNMVLPDEQLLSLGETFLTGYQQYQHDQRKDWVENIFANWFRTMSRTFRQQLYVELMSPSMQKKYQVTNEFLQELVNQRNNVLVVDLTPYEINRLFLHALTVSPNKWKDTFHYVFKEVYQFVHNGFLDHDNTQLANHLKNDSYPPVLMAQLQYLLDYYDYCHTEDGVDANQPQPVRMVFPMPQLVLSIQHLEVILWVTPDDKRVEFLDTLGNEQLKSIIKSGSNLVRVLVMLRKAKQVELKETLDNNYLKSIINNGYDLVAVLKILTKAKRTEFINTLDGEYLQSIIDNVFDLESVLIMLPKAKQVEFLNTLDSDYLKSIIQYGYGLYRVLARLPEAKQAEFIKTLNNDYLKSIIKNVSDLRSVLIILPESKQPEFLKTLDKAHLQSIIKDGDDLVKVLKTLPAANQPEFLKALGQAKCQEFLPIVDNFISFQGKIAIHLAAYVDDANIQNAITKAYDDYFYVTSKTGYQQDKHPLDSLITGLKIFGTFGIHCAYRCYKYDCSMSRTDQNKSATENLLTILNARNSNNDLQSFNYYITSYLSRMNAKTDDQAKTMVDTLKEYLINKLTSVESCDASALSKPHVGCL